VTRTDRNQCFSNSGNTAKQCKSKALMTHSDKARHDFLILVEITPSSNTRQSIFGT
jgi:hypothetical protein